MTGCLPQRLLPFTHRFSHIVAGGTLLVLAGRPNTAVPRCMSKVTRLPWGTTRTEEEVEKNTYTADVGRMSSFSSGQPTALLIACLCIYPSAAFKR